MYSNRNWIFQPHLYGLFSQSITEVIANCSIFCISNGRKLVHSSMRKTYMQLK
jgi:hypothetical protein